MYTSRPRHRRDVKGFVRFVNWGLQFGVGVVVEVEIQGMWARVGREARRNLIHIRQGVDSPLYHQDLFLCHTIKGDCRQFDQFVISKSYRSNKHSNVTRPLQDTTSGILVYYR
jgi:hypothetical protein